MPQGAIPVNVLNTAARGNSFFVDELAGNDNTGTGAAQRPFASLATALDAATAKNNDVVYGLGTFHTTAPLAWNKDGVSLVMLTSPSDNDRGRISPLGSASVFSPLVNVTAQGCSFINVGTFHGFNDASTQICWEELGGRNFYSACQFLGMGNATAAAQAGSRSLVVGGAGENLFVGCTAGLDTIVRATAANATLELVNHTPRNVFKEMIFQSLVSLATDVHIKVGSGGIDRYALFDRPKFLNAIESTGIAMNAAITAAADAGGAVCIEDPFSFGATALATTGPVYGTGNVPVATTSGIAIKLT